MFRYRCPNCNQLLQALEIRAGKLTVCSKCSQPLTIPAERSQWLNERGEPLTAPPTVVVPIRPPEVLVDPGDTDTDTDVLGAIFVGAEGAREIPPPTELVREFLTPPPIGPKAAVAPKPEPEPISPPKPPPKPEPIPEPVVRRPDPTPPPRSSPLRPAPVEPEPRDEPPAPAPKPPSSRPTPTRASVSEPPTDEARGRRFVVTRPTPPRRPSDQSASALALVTPPPKARESEAVSFDEPLHLRSQLDIAAELTSMLTQRMKPPPEPPRDVHLSTAFWLVATGVAVALLILALVSGDNDYLTWVFGIAVGQVLAGYVWIVAIAAHRDWRRGLAAAVPVVTPWFLTQWKYARYRPARFVLTGAVLVIVAALSGDVLPTTRGWLGADAPTPTASRADETAKLPKHLRLRAYRTDGPLPELLDLLEDLARTDSLMSADKDHRNEIAAELREACKHRDSGVRVRALHAYAIWGGDDARTLCLKFLESPNQDEREEALRLLPRWKDSEVARAVADQLGRTGNESTLARKGLEEIGGPIAEQALLPRLEAEDPGVRLQVIDLLASEGIGGPVALARLRQLADNPPATSRAFEDKSTRDRAGQKADVLAARLQKK